MKTKLTIILSILSIVGVLSIWGLWLFGTMKLSAVSLETFIGVIVALLAIIFTVIVGWQIVNAIEMRDEVKELRRQQVVIIENEKRLAENDRLHTMEAYNLQSAICQESAEAYISKGLYIEAFTFYHVALCYAIFADTPNQVSRIQRLQSILELITSKPVIDFTVLARQITADSDKIRQTTSYRNCLSGIYEQTMRLFWEKMKSLGLEIPV